MKQLFLTLCPMLATAFLLSSCLDNDTDEVALYDDTAITSFSLTGANLVKHTVGSGGRDSIYTISGATTVSAIKFHIDQVNRRIYNTEKLPMNVDVSKMLCSIGTRNNGVPFIEPLEPGDITYVSTTDSLDFSERRVVRVYSSNGAAYSADTIYVYRHTEDGDAFVWTRMADCPQLAGAEALRAAAIGGRTVALVAKGGQTLVMEAPQETGGSWGDPLATLGGGAWRNATVRNDSLFVLDGTALKASANGQHFSTIAGAAELRRLTGCSSRELYGQGADGQLLVSADGGRTWQPDSMAYEDREDSLRLAIQLPTRDVTCLGRPSSYMAQSDYVVMAGNRDVTQEDFKSDRNARTWRKIVDYANGRPQGRWICTNEYDESKWPLPAMEDLQLFAYDGALMAIGGKGTGACAVEAYSRIYESRDGGITWKKAAQVALPGGMGARPKAMGVTVDADNYIWLFCGGTGEVWRGRLNRLGWNE